MAANVTTPPRTAHSRQPASCRAPVTCFSGRSQAAGSQITPTPPPPLCRRRCSGLVSAPAAARLQPAWRLGAIRGVESYDSSFQLEPQQQETLAELLGSDMFAAEVVQNCKLPEGTRLEWTGVLFQPVPWSPATRKGMPQELEERFYDKPGFTIINVPPVFMFKAKVFQPPRLCTIYKHRE